MESKESPFLGLGIVMFVLITIFQIILGKQFMPAGSFIGLGIVLLLLLFYDFMLGLPSGSIFCLVTTIFALIYFLEVLATHLHIKKQHNKYDKPHGLPADRKSVV